MIHAGLDFVLRYLGPRQFTALVNDKSLRLPRELRGLIGVDRRRRSGVYFEKPVMTGLQAVLRPDSVVFDVGCSYGLIASLISKTAGPRVMIHAFEANAEVIEWARRVTALNCPAGQVQFVHACAGESSNGHATFYTVPGSKSVASTRNADIRHFHQTAVVEQVPLMSLDDYARNLAAPPSCIKIDVEGSEYMVLRGARGLIEDSHPALIIETHGLEIDGIGGSVRELANTLSDCGYHLTDLITEQRISPSAYAERYTTEIGYLLAIA